MDKSIQGFKVVGRFEGVSLLALFFFAMPMKYMANDPHYVRVIGMIHGLLFLFYVCYALVLNAESQWSKKKLLAAIVLSSLPFGTFYFERKFL